MSFTAQEKRAYDNRMEDLAQERRQNEREYFGISQDTLRNPPHKLGYHLPVSGLELREARQFNELITYVRTVQPADVSGKARTNIPPVRHAIDFRRHGPGRKHKDVEVVERYDTFVVTRLRQRPNLTLKARQAIQEGIQDVDNPQKHKYTTARYTMADILHMIPEARVRSILRDMKPAYSAAPGQLNLDREEEPSEALDDVIGPQIPSMFALTSEALQMWGIQNDSELEAHSLDIGVGTDLGLIGQRVVEVKPDGRKPLDARVASSLPTGYESSHLFEHMMEQATK